MQSRIILATERLIVRPAEIGDEELFFQLWTDPRVMSNVGFPKGLPTSRAEIRTQISAAGETVFSRLLVAALKVDGQPLGECWMSEPDAEKISSTDVKLLPAFWGKRYGVEIKRGLLDYLFAQTDCEAVAATPNVGNAASIKMQEAVGGIRIGEATSAFPESMQAYTVPVHHYIYRVRRADWLARRADGSKA